MNLASFIDLAARTLPKQARDQAARGIDPAPLMAVVACCESVAKHMGEFQPVESFAGLVDIDLIATDKGVRLRLAMNDDIPLAELYEMGKALDIVIVALQEKKRAWESMATKAKAG